MNIWESDVPPEKSRLENNSQSCSDIFPIGRFTLLFHPFFAFSNPSRYILKIKLCKKSFRITKREKTLLPDTLDMVVSKGMPRPGLEPGTSASSAQRSPRLSYLGTQGANC